MDWADYLRDEAAKFRQLAETAEDPSIKQELLELAAVCEEVASNVKRLVPIWSTSLSNEAGELSQPTIYNGVMYVVNGQWTFALDVATGRQIWRTPVEYERGAARVGQRSMPL
jgi:hypothetical protein